MQIPNFSQDQFLNAPTLNTSMGYIKNSLETSNKTFYTPGLLYSQDLIYTFNNSLTVSLNASPPFAVVDANGILSQALGTTNGTTSSVYTLDFSSFVPSSGSVTVYITATTFSLSLQPYQVIGPPIGHPDYNPSFAPYTAYGETVDSLSITLSTTAPNNQTVFELGRVVLTSGQTAVTSVTTSYQVNCELYISAIDIQPVQNAIQIGQTTSTNQAVIAGVIPSGVSNNLIQFLVNGSNVFIVDVDGNITSAGNLTISGSINSGAITASGLITANGGIATSSIAGNPSFTGGLTVPSGETLTVGGNTVVDTLTSSGLITANGGLTVPSGQTATVAGTLDVSGTSTLATADITTLNVSGNAPNMPLSGTIPGLFSIQNAQTPSQPVALGQINASIGNSGYQKLPSGIIIQWGAVTSNNTYTFPITFPNACLSLTFGIYTTAAIFAVAYQTSPIPTNGNFIFQTWNASGAGVTNISGYYIAIGY